MAGIARANVDWAGTHTDGDTHLSPTQTTYLASGSNKVYIGGHQAIVKDDLLACGDKTKGASSKVFINGKGVHRLGDSIDSHAGTYSAAVCEKASTEVFAG